MLYKGKHLLDKAGDPLRQKALWAFPLGVGQRQSIQTLLELFACPNPLPPLVASKRFCLVIKVPHVSHPLLDAHILGTPLRKRFEVPEIMHPAALMKTQMIRIGRQKVAHHDPPIPLPQNPGRHRLAPALIHDEQPRFRGAKAPQPVVLSVFPPAGLVPMHEGAASHFLLKRLVNSLAKAGGRVQSLRNLPDRQMQTPQAFHKPLDTANRHPARLLQIDQKAHQPNAYPVLAYNLTRKVRRSYVVLTADAAAAAEKPMLYDLIADNRNLDHLPNPMHPAAKKLAPAIRALFHCVLGNLRRLLAVTNIRVRALLLGSLRLGGTGRLHKGRNCPRYTRRRVLLETLDLCAQSTHFRLKKLIAFPQLLRQSDQLFS